MQIDEMGAALVGAGCHVLFRGPSWLVAAVSLPKAIRVLQSTRILGMEGFTYDPATGEISPDMDMIADLSLVGADDAAAAAERIAKGWQEAQVYVEIVTDSGGGWNEVDSGHPVR